MKFKYTALYAAILSASLGMVGCSSGSGSTTGATGGTVTGATTSVTGRVTGFGSVFVDGVEYETPSTTTVTRDGIAATVPADQILRVGMIVTLNGTANGTTGEAASIEFKDDLEGLVQGNGLPTGSLLVMGQNITVDANTNFESADATITAVEDIPPNAVVEISGYPDGNGNILATYIELKVADVTVADSGYTDDMEVKGLIANLDATAKTFMLGNIAVDYSALTLSADVVPADGLFVEVKFNVVTDSAGKSSLEVIKMELEDGGEYGVSGETGDDFGLEGVISNIDLTAGTFALNGQTIQIPTGFTLPNFAGGELVNLDVTVAANGDIEVKDIEHDEANDDGSNLKLVAQVTAIDAAAGTIEIDGKTVSVDRFTTIMKDDLSTSSDQDRRFFNIDNINVDDWLEMKIAEDATTGNLSAIKIERIDASDAREEDEVVVSLDASGVPFAGDLNLNTALASNQTALDLITALATASDEGLEVAISVNPDTAALESLILDVEGKITIDALTDVVSIDGIDLSALNLSADELTGIRARAGQEAEAKIDLVTSSVIGMRSNLSGVVAVDVETGDVTVDGVAVTLPLGMSLEAGQNVEMDIDAAGNVTGFDIELDHERREREAAAGGTTTAPTTGTTPIG